MGLPMLEGPAAFGIISSIATAGLCLAYALPIGLRLLFAHHSFEPGPFHLGRYGCLFTVLMHFLSCSLPYSPTDVLAHSLICSSPHLCSRTLTCLLAT